MEYIDAHRTGVRKHAALHQALGHPIRLSILEILAHGEACVCHLTTLLGRRQPYVSQQLAALRQAELVADRREGTLIYYRIRDARLVALLELGRTLIGIERGEAMGPTWRLSDEPLPNCPCPKCQDGFQRPGKGQSIRIHA